MFRLLLQFYTQISRWKLLRLSCFWALFGSRGVEKRKTADTSICSLPFSYELLTILRVLRLLA